MTALAVVNREFKVWKTIKLGTHRNIDALSAFLYRTGCKIATWAALDILGSLTSLIFSEEEEADLVLVSVADLGFKLAGYDAICAKGENLGLALCSAEVALQLCIQYRDQPIGETITVAMEPIFIPRGYRSYFSVEREDGERRLSAYSAEAGRLWDGDDRFVFLQRRPTKRIMRRE